jgi:hypothetical protein
VEDPELQPGIEGIIGIEWKLNILNDHQEHNGNVE